jgi:flagellar protein FlaG
MLQRIDGPAPSTPAAVEGAGASAPAREPRLPPARADPPAAQADAEAIAEQVRAAVSEANRNIRAFTKALEFEIDSDTHTVVVRLVDTEDGRVLRQVPSQEMLAIARALERMQAQLVRSEA